MNERHKRCTLETETCTLITRRYTTFTSNDQYGQYAVKGENGEKRNRNIDEDKMLKCFIVYVCRPIVSSIERLHCIASNWRLTKMVKKNREEFLRINMPGFFSDPFNVFVAAQNDNATARSNTYWYCFCFQWTVFHYYHLSSLSSFPQVSFSNQIPPVSLFESQPMATNKWRKKSKMGKRRCA